MQVYTGRLDVYRNLSRKDMPIFSIRGKGPDGKTKVLGYETSFALSGVSLKASEAGQARIVGQGQREVVAWAQGTQVDPASLVAGRQVTYNPFRSSVFHYADTGEAVSSLSYAIFGEGRMFEASLR